ncbi:chromosome segregation protein SMC [Alteromonas sp. 345S023]|uniref:Chromosome partition protein Smc n=1 Tax=Alteromonas profundi TaxID=2696062 RepID=A0A7X5RLD4_9ALTE|nr:chromosome segregation protein SMC [Alteromonas profundi]
MRLKKIRLAGFKSFVDPTNIPFPGDMTAVVGPNGCGKSNVIDAVRWVLGESSAKNLRGDAMTDVIFNGSSARKPVGQCSVELVFDNSAGRIGGEYANYSELSVRRLVTRDGQSSYFLNGTKCRKRDVTDLFLGTGLGPRSYAIIEQGMISRLIESKPQELRVFIEEAAGISKYKERRRETENRIRHTQDNLTRLDDVRDELAQQIEKLQRQAAAATRYKTLRGRLRELKGQLAAIRFNQINQHIDSLQAQQSTYQQQLDALVSQSKGDEAGIQRYRTQHSELKQTIDDIQQAIFTTSNSITRLEQNALHRQQRLNQINRELEEIEQQINLLVSSKSEAENALVRSRAELDKLMPQQALVEEEHEQAEQAFIEAEEKLREFNIQSREHEQTYHRLKQEVQACHSQIQATMSMQLRTSQRISELNDERAQLDEENLADKITTVEAQIEEARQQCALGEESDKNAKQTVLDYQQQLKRVQSEANQLAGRQQSVRSTQAALMALQEDAGGIPDTLDDTIKPLWQVLDVPPSLSRCTEVVLHGWHQPYVLLNNDEIITDPHSDHCLPKGVPIFINHQFTDKKSSGTLAKALTSARVPRAFNDIFLFEQDAGALATRETLASHQSALAYSGLWCGRDWVVLPGEREDGVIQRANKIAQLTQELTQIDTEYAQIEAQAAIITEKLAEAEEARATCESLWQEAKSVVTNLASSLSLLTMQQEQQQTRSSKVRTELAKHNEILQKEEKQLAALSEKLEVAEAQILEHEVHVETVSAQREHYENKVNTLRGKVASLTQKVHDLALKYQQLENHQALYQQQVDRNNEQLSSYQKRQQNLVEEKEQLSAPQTQQDQQLQALLDEKQQLEAQRGDYQAQQEKVMSLLNETEKGQQALTKEIQSRTRDIEKLNIDIEGYRVRSNALIEQLAEDKLSLNSIIPTLPENADEATWQKELEKTQNSLTRLGAVNLAAVEEFDIQSERKRHLDTQYNDLNEALETLQSAIRKIDKETRTRFSNTFEQVNSDLKTLFPKVFGGGSAYLALTDDDLLETGVTIMARPPGKKNSTIHLLSGGEKALTALSLVFAIFRLNPAPFCLLDEVDAPLDDANVGRFCNLVSEMSQTVQFIYITHNKIAMEMASHLTGVTMAEPGVSRMVAVDVDEAVAFAEA